ncbi:MAG: hypothetical protein ACQEQE_08700 [Bacillota bacterium]
MNKKIKNYKRQDRLEVAKKWIENYEGEDVVSDYSKYFGVNKVCTVQELEILEYGLSQEYMNEIKRVYEYNLKNKNQKLDEISGNEFQNSEFYFIAGYTPGGFPFGITWEEHEKEKSGEKKNEIEVEKDSDGIPF